MTPPAPALVAAPVWDIFVRLFHWSLATLVVIAVVTGKVGGNAIQWHMVAGGGILALVLFRVMWGFAGGEYARFISFVASPARTLRFARGLIGRGHEYVIGHNPLGGWMVLAMLALFTTQAVFGLFSNDEIMTTGPLARYVSDETSIAFMSRHRILAPVLIVLVALHIAAVLYHLFVKNENLVRPMLHGRKSLPAALAAEARGGRKASIALGVTLLAVAIAAVVTVFQWSKLFPG